LDGEAARVDAVDGGLRNLCERIGTMKTIRFLMAMLIVVAMGAGVAGSASGAEKVGGMKTLPRVEKGERMEVRKDMKKATDKAAKKPAQKAAAKAVKPEKDVQRKATDEKKLEVGKKADVRKKNA